MTDCNHSHLLVRDIEPKGKGVFAARNFSKGETVASGRKVRILPQRTPHSIQMDFDLHVLIDEPAVLINHCCQPNTGVRNNPWGGYDFVALIDIAAGDEITFDYETTETEFSAKFQSACNVSECRKQLCGFFHLPTEVQKSYGEFIADYLKAKARN
ncbi:SET domain-containing protein-lysine N-methyltransferase [Oscillatoriales cyanobacterium LEGE 11467]|uniref:SET domain-containing protein-lysine N-methyltransferase n=1 Tax=Zarconia navalis LEGE 11467 TaxID=1828826 RepID=A0A928VV16_9CYAN|nr:SET domain-containing protein [Zarconia navalis]MBE9040019.1 SET domain-containing protein-lysine N-methyltransferase [Zarconia navalis LEGE 11467]